MIKLEDYSANAIKEKSHYLEGAVWMSKIIFVSFYLSVGKVLDEVDKYNSELSLLAEDYEQKNIYVLENVPLESKNQVTNI